jgi:pimeloyl-ACP methyl ester carboxylesterase
VRAGRIVIACLLLAAAACGGSNNDAGADDTSGVKEAAVKFKTSDGRTLTGHLFGSGRVGVTLGHMFPADATSWYPSARRLAKAGYMALAFNFRGYGDSGGNKQVVKAPIDIAAAQSYLKRRGARDVAFVGASMGATASLVAAEGSEALAVVAISAPSRFMGLDAIGVATRIQRPVLLMSARNDDAAFQSVEELERALPNPDTKIYDGDAHGTNLLDTRPEAVDEVISFLQRYAPLTRTVSTQSP